jgi:ribosomal protein S5
MLRKFSKIPLNGQSVPHEQKVIGGARVFFNPCLMVQVIAGGAVRSVLGVSRNHDVLSKSRIQILNVAATLMLYYK